MDAKQLRPIDTTTPEAVVAGLDNQVDLWSRAEVVAVGWTARTVRELHVVAHGIVRLLVGRLGFRSVLIEGDRDASAELDDLVCGGTGDLRVTLARARPFLASVEMLELVQWLQRWNDSSGAQHVRIVHGGRDDLSSPQALEQSLADQVLAWHRQFGHRIVYLGGAFHTAVAAERTMAASPDDPTASAGSRLRSAFGNRYVSLGLTFGAGAIPQPVPPPAPGTLEAALDTFAHPAVLVLSSSLRTSPPRADRPDRIRIVGPDYDPDHDASHAMVGDPAEWFDLVVHQRVGTAVRFLD